MTEDRSEEGCRVGSVDGPDDAVIEARLRAVAPEQWDRLWRAVDSVVDDPGSHARWITPERLPDGSMRLPWVRYSDTMFEISRVLHEADLMIGFAWMRWRDGIDRYLGKPDVVAAAPIADVLRVLTAIERGDRFTEGTIAGALNDGTLPAAWRALRTWHDRQRRPLGFRWRRIVRRVGRGGAL